MENYKKCALKECQTQILNTKGDEPEYCPEHNYLNEKYKIIAEKIIRHVNKIEEILKDNNLKNFESGSNDYKFTITINK